jgi:hypothetical protein
VNVNVKVKGVTSEEKEFQSNRKTLWMAMLCQCHRPRTTTEKSPYHSIANESSSATLLPVAVPTVRRKVLLLLLVLVLAVLAVLVYVLVDNSLPRNIPVNVIPPSLTLLHRHPLTISDFVVARKI